VAVNPENKILFKKVDQDGKALANAKFKLKYKQKAAEGEWSYVKDENNNDLVKTSGEDGKFEYTKLKPGFYELEETSAPDGYNILANPAYEFVVNSNGKIIRKTIGDKPNEEKDTEEDGIVPIYIENKKEQKISFKKVDASNKDKKLAGAKFEVWYKKDKGEEKYSTTALKLYEKTSGGKTERLVLKDGETAPTGYTNVDNFTTGKDGKIEFTFYENGYYALKETKAPSGYITPRDYVKEFVVKDGKVQILEKDPLKASLTKGANSMITSEIREVDKDKGTFKQRLVINPGHTQWTFDEHDTLLQLDVNNWNVSDNYRTIKVATLEKGKTVADLKDTDFKEVNPRNQGYNTNPLIYSIPSLYNANDYTKPSPTISNL
ncbi:MAG: SpaA isopeptide-forming pilin-related protein, partial [Finegoldia magna]|nr:SpaA isopeptide-forming pilin-related protein [Finegoldia magna]